MGAGLGRAVRGGTALKGLLPMVVLLGLCLGSAGTADAWVAAKVGGQFAGSVGTSGSIDYLKSLPNLDWDSWASDPSWSVAVEGDFPLGDHFSVGGGLEYMGGRSFSGVLPGYISMLPLYAKGRAILTGKDSMFRPYILGQIGYSWNFLSSSLENTLKAIEGQLKSITDSSTDGGLYWSAGLGAYLFKFVMVELTYMECRGSFTANSVQGAHTDLTYRAVGFYAGVHF